MAPMTSLNRTSKGQAQATNRALQLPNGLNRILELTGEKVSMEQISAQLPQVAPAKLHRAVDYLVQEGFLEPDAEPARPARANFLAPPVIEVEEMDSQSGVFAWAEARRGAKMLANEGFYAQRTLAAAPDHPPVVLLVEDDADMAGMITLLLTAEGLQVRHARDAEQAMLDLDGHGLPDVALFDVVLPGMDGFELLEQLRANPDREQLPVIMVTGQAGDKDVLRGLHGGADGYIFKPFRPEVLVSSVRKMLGMQ